MKHIILCLALVLMLAGCGNTGNVQTTSEAETEATTEVTTEATVESTVETTEAAVETTQAAEQDIPFSTTDIDGQEYTHEIFASHSLTVLNFWEPWCGPCVMEMPYLQRISQEYADRGVLILGIYATPDAEEEVAAVLADTGVTYPILHYTSAFNFLQTGYVPTTVIVDSTGHIVQSPFAGSLPYDQWVSMIEGLL